MKTVLIILAALIIIPVLSSCDDIMETEPNFDKELVYKKPNREDSLSFLSIIPGDFGNVKYRTVNNMSLSIVNESQNDNITIYGIRSVNTSGLFTYSYPSGFPFDILPGENTELTGKLKVKFVATDLTFGHHYDTLFLNGSSNMYIAIHAKVYY